MLSTLILKSEALVSRFPRINNNAHADMHNAHQHGCGNIHINEHLLHNLVLGEEIYQISKIAKTSVNKRL